MKEKIENKITEIIELILRKPAVRVTLDDYTILAAELRDIRFREEQEANGKRIAELMAGTIGFGFGGKPEEVK